jgi:hypothetical protein
MDEAETKAGDGGLDLVRLGEALCFGALLSKQCLKNLLHKGQSG